MLQPAGGRAGVIDHSPWRQLLFAMIGSEFRIPRNFLEVKFTFKDFIKKEKGKIPPAPFKKGERIGHLSKFIVFCSIVTVMQRSL